MRFFIAGIMQGSHTAKALHEQDYRRQVSELLASHFPEADVYDPRAKHRNSLEYADLTGREVFFRHNAMCREVDALVAVLPAASMGTAVEMWEAYRSGAAVISISPMEHNWVVRFLSHAVYRNLDELAAALTRGEVAQCIQRVRSEPPPVV
ncbi:MAG: hypothetical protein U1E05_11615 [Patescibacteria group bacterium]|nr:hypothetical protein [Patescibacteria group bacterium]